jgi:hypothetical protein
MGNAEETAYILSMAMSLSGLGAPSEQKLNNASKFSVKNKFKKQSLMQKKISLKRCVMGHRHLNTANIKEVIAINMLFCSHNYRILSQL